MIDSVYFSSFSNILIHPTQIISFFFRTKKYLTLITNRLAGRSDTMASQKTNLKQRLMCVSQSESGYRGPILQPLLTTPYPSPKGLQRICDATNGVPFHSI